MLNNGDAFDAGWMGGVVLGVIDSIITWRFIRTLIVGAEVNDSVSFSTNATYCLHTSLHKKKGRAEAPPQVS
jgi:hypothetical protein